MRGCSNGGYVLSGFQSLQDNDANGAKANFHAKLAAVPVPQEGWVDTLTQAGLSRQSAESMAELHESINNGRIAFLDPNAKKGRIDLANFVEKLVA